MQRFEPFGGASMQECIEGDYVRVEDVRAIIAGCWDYSGGHGGNAEALAIYRHGMQTIKNAMDAAMKSDPSDTQSNATLAIGRSTLNRQ